MTGERERHASPDLGGGGRLTREDRRARRTAAPDARPGGRPPPAPGDGGPLVRRPLRPRRRRGLADEPGRADAGGAARRPRVREGGEMKSARPPLHVRRVGGVAVVGIGDLAGGELLDPEVRLVELLEAEPRGLVVDLAGADPVWDSLLLADMIGVSRLARSLSRPFRLCCASPSIREAFSITKLEAFIPLFSTLADALQGM